MKNEFFSGKLYFIGAFSLAGTSVVAARFVSDSIGVFTTAAISMALALCLLIPVSARKLRAAVKALSLQQGASVLLQALFGMFLFRFLLLSGVARTSALEAGILTGATPAVTALLAWTLLRERVGTASIVGILSTVAGVLLVQGIAKVGVASGGSHLVGNLLVLGAAASESVFNIISRTFAIQKADRGDPLDPLVQTTLVTFAALLFCIVPALFERPIERIAALGAVEWLALLWYGIFVTALAYLYWYAGIKRCGAFTAAAFSGLMPMTSMILSALLLKESADVFQIIGGACIIAGMMLIGRRKKKRPELSSMLPLF